MYLMFLTIRIIDKQSLKNKFYGFILILSVPWGQLRTKCPCHTTFFQRSGLFFICFCGNTDVALDGHNRPDGFIVTTWTLSPLWSYKTQVDEVHSIALIYQNFEIPNFCIVWLIIFHQDTDITTWNKANNTGKIFISKIKYLKMLKIYLSAVNIKFQ